MKSVIILLFALLLFEASAHAAKPEDIKATSFKVYGNCGMCKSRIEKALKVNGVESAKWNSKNKMIDITYNEKEIKEEKLHQLIANVGHDTEKINAENEVYNKLHSCCKYERKDAAGKKGGKNQQQTGNEHK
jgi:periplasmic mercuric ion binding protein